ncbi:MAG: hypothetical protein AAF811_04720 [Pseudomonadota bacterium]
MVLRMMGNRWRKTVTAACFMAVVQGPYAFAQGATAGGEASVSLADIYSRLPQHEKLLLLLIAAALLLMLIIHVARLLEPRPLQDDPTQDRAMPPPRAADRFEAIQRLRDRIAAEALRQEAAVADAAEASAASEPGPKASERLDHSCASQSALQLEDSQVEHSQVEHSQVERGEVERGEVEHTQVKHDDARQTLSVADAAHVLDLVEQDLAMNRDWALRARSKKTRRTAPRRLNSWRRDLGGARLEARPAAEPVGRTQPAEKALEAVPTVKTATMGDILLHRIRSVGQSASERRRALERNTDGA